MGFKETGLLLMLFFYLHLPASSSPLNQSSFSAFVQENHVGDKGIDKKISTRGERGQISSVIKRGVGGGRGGGGHSGGHGRSFGHGGGGGGRSSSTGVNGNSGNSKLPYTQGSTSFIPIYTAGAGGAASSRQNHQHHHNAGSSNSRFVGITTLVAAILASLVLHLYSSWT